MRHTIPTILLLALAVPAWADERPYEEPELPASARDHWSYRPVKRPAVPQNRNAIFRQPNAIDAFILARLDQAGLKPSPEADKLTLIRRLTFDLHGLPPTPEEIDAFLKDESANAYEKLVDRLLASPHFGERWAQHWLDVVRFAESNGFELDAERPHAWRYRDYVVKSFNEDKPYDRFLTEQLAGDLLAQGKSPQEAAELWIATGMNRCGPIHVVSGNLDPEETRQEKLIEIVNGFGSAVLGLTMACTRCHDHKFDPLTQGDYFRLQAFFADADYKDLSFATDEEKRVHKERTDAVMVKLNPIKKRIAEIEAPYRKKLTEEKRAKLPEAVRAALDIEPGKRTPEQKKLAETAKPLLMLLWDEVIDALSPEHKAERQKLKQEQLKLEDSLPPPLPTAWALAETKLKPVHVLKRGDWRRKQSPISAGYVNVVSETPPEPKSRLDLARWVTNPHHPLTSRVIVNRLWQHHFGRGIVATPNDYGSRGERPTHPELLDWLASELVKPTDPEGKPWALKRLHKLMVMSATYRQVSDHEPSAIGMTTDPENKLLWRMNRRRLDAEAIRDAILTAAGTLNRQIGGPSVKVPLEPEVYDLLFTEGEPVGLWPVTPDDKQHIRRSLYLFAKRNVRQPLLEAFDQPDTLGSCAVRGASTFAPQALILMNGPFTHAQSQSMASSLMKAGVSQDWIVAACRRTLGRRPTASELTKLTSFFNEQTRQIGSQEPAADANRRALADVCRALFNSNEFVFVP